MQVRNCTNKACPTCHKLRERIRQSRAHQQQQHGGMPLGQPGSFSMGMQVMGMGIGHAPMHHVCRCPCPCPCHMFMSMPHVHATRPCSHVPRGSRLDRSLPAQGSYNPLMGGGGGFGLAGMGGHDQYASYRTNT